MLLWPILLLHRAVIAVDFALRFAMFASLVLVGLVAGMFLATQLGQVRVQNTLGARDFTLVKHGFEVAVGRVMQFLSSQPECRSSY